jgi:succinate dehydrogenase / fumarate reductase flavoprotein subunit
MGGLWVDYERHPEGGLIEGSTRNQQTNIPGLYAIGECDYQFHGANRLGANSLLSCIFSGLFVAPSIQAMLSSLKGSAGDDNFRGLMQTASAGKQAEHDKLLKRDGGGENPYLIHQDLGRVMTETATVVRQNDQMTRAYEKVRELEARMARCSLSDTGHWTNQNVVFTKALRDMFPLAKAILKGALMRDESRGAHFKPDFTMPGLTADDPAERRHQAEGWCDEFQKKNEKWLKTTIATFKDGEPTISYEEVDTSLIPPRPRLYGLKGAEMIEEVWTERQAAKDAAAQRQPVTA